MKKTIFTLSIIASQLLSENVANAQTFLNGSFENTTAPACSPGSGFTNSAFNGYMNDCVAYGTSNQIDVFNSTCGWGIPQSGSRFIALVSNLSTNKSDALSMELSSPLIPGQLYELTFYNRSVASFTVGGKLKISYSNAPLTAGASGTLIGIADSMASTSWELNSFKFYATGSNMTFINIDVIPGNYGGSGPGQTWNAIDNFKITKLVGKLNTTTKDWPYKTFPVIGPNPVAALVTINAEKGAPVKQVIIRNMQGETVLITNETSIDMSSMQSGMYIFEITTEQGVSYEKVIKE